MQFSSSAHRIGLVLLMLQMGTYSAASHTTGFIPIVANLRPPSNFQRQEHNGHRTSIDLRRHRPNFPVRSNEAAAATTTLHREITPEIEYSLGDSDGLNWQDPAAVILYNCVALQLLIISLSGQLQASFPLHIFRLVLS